MWVFQEQSAPHDLRRSEQFLHVIASFITIIFPLRVERTRVAILTPRIFSSAEPQGFDMLKQLFQGQLVLRTRCLECECYTERREDFQDISVPVQEDETICSEPSSESECLQKNGR